MVISGTEALTHPVLSDFDGTAGSTPSGCEPLSIRSDARRVGARHSNPVTRALNRYTPFRTQFNTGFTGFSPHRNPSETVVHSGTERNV